MNWIESYVIFFPTFTEYRVVVLEGKKEITLKYADAKAANAAHPGAFDIDADEEDEEDEI